MSEPVSRVFGQAKACVDLCRVVRGARDHRGHGLVGSRDRVAKRPAARQRSGAGSTGRGGGAPERRAGALRVPAVAARDLARRAAVARCARRCGLAREGQPLPAGAQRDRRRRQPLRARPLRHRGGCRRSRPARHAVRTGPVVPAVHARCAGPRTRPLLRHGHHERARRLLPVVCAAQRRPAARRGDRQGEPGGRRTRMARSAGRRAGRRRAAGRDPRLARRVEVPPARRDVAVRARPRPRRSAAMAARNWCRSTGARASASESARRGSASDRTPTSPPSAGSTTIVGG